MKMIHFLNTNICIVLALVASAVALVNEDTNYTAAEKKSLKQFREIVSDLLYLDYQNEDSFLISWLRPADLDQNRAKELLASSLKWRKENGIDSLLEDPRMIKLEKVFPHSLDTVDKEGRPIVTLHFQSWNIRKIMLAGKGKDLTRYIDYLFEKGTTKIRVLANSTQTDITQALLLIDMNGYNLRQHACLGCISFYFDLIQHYTRHYPYKLKYIILINTSRIFDSLLQILLPIMPPYLKRSLTIYGINKAEWSQALLRIIPQDQLELTFGGSRGQNKL